MSDEYDKSVIEEKRKWLIERFTARWEYQGTWSQWSKDMMRKRLETGDDYWVSCLYDLVKEKL
jgi:hypothetical protein